MLCPIHRNAAVMSDLFCLFSFSVDILKGDNALTEITSFEVKWDKQKSIWIYQYIDIQPGETMMRMRIYQNKFVVLSM